MNVMYLTPELEDSILCGVQPYSQKGMDIFQDWINRNNVYYYVATREAFNINDGIRTAERLGCDAVLAEDLS